MDEQSHSADLAEACGGGDGNAEGLIVAVGVRAGIMAEGADVACDDVGDLGGFYIGAGCFDQFGNSRCFTQDGWIHGDDDGNCGCVVGLYRLAIIFSVTASVAVEVVGF